MTEQEGFIAAIADRDSLIKRLANDYANDADTMAAAHKAERDALKDAARFALDALEYHTAQTRPIERTQIAIEILKAAL